MGKKDAAAIAVTGGKIGDAPHICRFGLDEN
jgi:hypothetical protein